MNYLITGASGSLGNGLIKALLLDSNATRIVCLSRDELKQSQQAELYRDKRLRFFLGDVRDKRRLTHAMHDIDVVIHAAALKRVDSISYNPSEVIKTNILGTCNVIEAAWDNRVRKVVVVSSDKAVEPMNIYGISKAMAEAYAIQANVYTFPAGTSVAVVRYGNVLGSRGSVVERWRTMTEVKAADCTRFWLTMDQAVSFISKVIFKMVPGCIYVPKLKAASIEELAVAMGKTVVGVEPLRVGGEKRAEKLLSTDELERTYDLGFAYCVMPALSPWDPGMSLPPDYLLRNRKEYSSETIERFGMEELRAML